MTEEDEAVVAQYSYLKEVSDRVRGSEICVFRSVHVGASVDAVIVLYSGPVEMSVVPVVMELAFFANMTAWLLEYTVEKVRSSRRWR